jgi:2-polyprenyl-6-methoxyphenol hydroxylase-like FAD-dependent oxidoreductase
MARIIVVGGSLGGLLVANMLCRAGHEVTVLEKALGSLDGRGAGIVTHSLLVAAMERCGVKIDVSLGVTVSDRIVLAKDGSVLDQTSVPQVLSSWSRLYALLLAEFDPCCYLHGASVKGITDQGGGVTVVCEDGRRFDADLVVASDGIRSAVRAQFAPDVQAQYAGYVAWRGVCDESVLSPHTLNTLFNSFGFSVPPGELIIGYPVAGAGNSIATGQRRYNFVWYRSTSGEEELQTLLTDIEGNCHPLGIPPNKVALQHVSAMRRAAGELLPPQFAEVIEKTRHPFLQPIYDCCSPKIAFGRVALMGDAAFVARPHVGMGVTKAAEDAMALTDLIAMHGATPQALQAFEQQRLAPASAAVSRARALGDRMQAQNEWGAGPVARTMMLETAIDLSEKPLEKFVEFEQA